MIVHTLKTLGLNAHQQILMNVPDDYTTVVEISASIPSEVLDANVEKAILETEFIAQILMNVLHPSKNVILTLLVQIALDLLRVPVIEDIQEMEPFAKT